MPTYSKYNVHNSSITLVHREPFTALSVDDIKDHLFGMGVTADTTQDSYINTLLQAACLYCERRTQLDFRETQWQLRLSTFPIYASYGYGYGAYGGYTGYGAYGNRYGWWGGMRAIDLTRGPLLSIEQISYFNGSNVSTVLDPSSYVIASGSYDKGKVEPIQYWQITYPRYDAVTIDFTTGFPEIGGSGSGESMTVPENILQAIRLLCGQWFQAREDISYSPNTVFGVTGDAICSLLDQHTVTAVG